VTAIERAVSGLLLLLLGLACNGCVSTSPPPRPTSTDLVAVKRLVVVIPPEPAFTVVHTRAKGASPGTAAAGAIGGVVGLLIVGGIDSASAEDKDQKRTQQVAPRLAGFSAREALVRGLVSTLDEARRFESVEVLEAPPAADSPVKADALLHVAVTQWGLHLVADRAGEALAGFAALEARMTLLPAGRSVWDEKSTVGGQRRHTLDQYTREDGLLRKELEETMESAGQRVASELLYPRDTR
jgi:hypothetical protein